MKRWYPRTNPKRASILALRDEWMDGGRSRQARIGYGALVDFLTGECRSADPQLMSRATPFAMPIRAARGDHSASHFHHRIPLLKRIAARLIRFDGTYHRFTGKVTIEKFERSLRVERFDDRAI